MEYQCKRCGYNTPTKCNLLKHLQRKKTCEPSVSDVSIEDMRDELRKKLNDTYKCSYCEKYYSAHQSMYRHQKNCKDRVKTSEERREYDLLLARVKQLEDKPTTSIVIHNAPVITNNTIQNNITIKSFGSESLDHIPVEQLTHYFMMKDIPALIRNIHFDDECKENRNVLLKSVKHGTSVTYQDGDWVVQRTDSVVKQLVDKGQTILKKHYRGNKSHLECEMTDEEIQETLLWLVDVFQNKKQTLLPLKRELLALLENYRYEGNQL